MDVSKIKDQVKIERFEKDLFQLDTTHFLTSFKVFRKKYPDITDAFMYQLFDNFFFKNKPHDSDQLFNSWKTFFLENKTMMTLDSDIQKTYGDKEIKLLEDQLTNAFRHVKYYFPKDTIPTFATIISVFSYKCYITTSNRYCISLDMFMGENYKYYTSREIDIPGYVAKNLRKEYILPSVIKAYCTEKYTSKVQTDNTLLSEVIQAGKMLYFLDAMAPEMDDSLKIEYSGKQLKWCKDNAGEIWGYFTGKDIFFKTDNSYKIKFLKDAPFTNADGIPSESAPRLGVWVGWQIVRKYMDQHKEVSLDQLMLDKDYKKILKESRYHPKK